MSLAFSTALFKMGITNEKPPLEAEVIISHIFINPVSFGPQSQRLPSGLYFAILPQGKPESNTP